MATVIKLKRSTTASATPTTSDLEDGEVAVNIADKKIYVRNGASIVAVANFDDGAASVDLTNVGSDVIPDGNNTRNLGSSTNRWAELFLSGSTINLGGSTISSDGTGTVNISSSGVTLPLGSKVDIDGANTKEVALVDEAGRTLITVPFFTASGGLSTPAVRLNFRARTAGATIANFTLEDGTALAETGDELFLF